MALIANGALLFAAADWVSFIIPIVFFVIYALNQLFGAKPKAPATRPPRRPEAERPVRPPQPASSPGPSSKLNDEIEQFLKRANDRRSDRPQRERAANVARPPKPAAKPRAEKPVAAEVVERSERNSVSESVEKHLANRQFTQRSEHLADEIVRADEQMEVHLQKSFNRRVGTLGESEAATARDVPLTDTETAVVTAPASSASIVGALLSNPQQLKQAIVLAEILARPEHRW